MPNILTLKNAVEQFKITTVTGNGSIQWNGLQNDKVPLRSLKFFGACQQSGTPTPEAPVPIVYNNAKWTSPVLNQHCFSPDFSEQSAWTATSLASVSLSFDGNTAIVVGTEDGVRANFYPSSDYRHLCLPSRKYLISTDVKVSNAMYVDLGFLRSDSRFYSTSWTRTRFWLSESEDFSRLVYLKSSPESLSDNYFFGVGCVNSAATAGTKYIKNPQYIDLTQMFGEEIAETIASEQDAHRLGLPQGLLDYNEGTPMYGTVDLSLIGGLYAVGNVKDEWDAQTGKGIRRCGAISSYAGEDVGDIWISSTGGKDDGAQIVYVLQTPTPFTTEAQPITQPMGIGMLFQQSGDIENTHVSVQSVSHT